MSNRELAKNMIDRLPDDKMIFIVNILENIGELFTTNLYQDHTPNAETIEAIEEIENGGGFKFSGSTEDLFAKLMED